MSCWRSGTRERPKRSCRQSPGELRCASVSLILLESGELSLFLCLPSHSRYKLKSMFEFQLVSVELSRSSTIDREAVRGMRCARGRWMVRSTPHDQHRASSQNQMQHRRRTVASRPGWAIAGGSKADSDRVQN